MYMLGSQSQGKMKPTFEWVLFFPDISLHLKSQDS